MSPSKQSIENLIDLVEIKIGCLQVIDRRDARELRHLEVCRRELICLQEKASTQHSLSFEPSPRLPLARHAAMHGSDSANTKRAADTATYEEIRSEQVIANRP